ncbi:glycosyl hydrolase [Cohnella sp. GCM10012308]|uniref:glycosyl hydrolase n=1 Tax=Cohnella sp. GCM10012308 TaxID=3317329 RepID=UPI00360B0BA5
MRIGSKHGLSASLWALLVALLAWNAWPSGALAADTQAPTAPASLTATAASGAQINLSWPAASDNVGVTGYDVYRYGTKIASTTGTSYSNTALTASTSYSYAIRAKDAAGNVSAFSPTAAAITTPVPATATVKKGVGSSKYLASGQSQADFAKLTNIGVGWTYNWSIDFPGTNGTSIEYVPQIWGPGAVTSSTLTTIAQGKAAGKFKALLAFNEPDLYEQANMSVESAVALWPTLMSTGLRLGSPAVAMSAETYAYGQTWLENFMSQTAANGYHVDFIAVHYYPDFMHPNAAENLRISLTNLYNLYHKPIWITELGAIDAGQLSAAPTTAGAQKFMTEAVAMLEGLPFVERYAWFDDNCSNDAGCAYTTLYDASNNLTAIGTTYKALPKTPLFRFGWTATASPAGIEATSNMFDNNPATRWTTGQAQASGQYFVVDMTGSRTFSRIVLDANGSSDYARGYQVFVSSNGTSWGSAIASGTGTGPVITIDFAPVTARYIKVVQTGTAPANYWSVHEFNAYS